jgi:catechol 2,3-dioxygenase-like lactoylglutathione lyase family enzyme
MKAPSFEGTLIFVTDISKSRHFYEEILGQEIMYDLENNIQYMSGISLWQLRKEHFLNEKLNLDLKSNRFEFYFESENLEELEKKLISQKVNFLHSVHVETWGQKTLRFFDPDNHLIEVGEEMHTYITRMHNEGESLEIIHKRTLLPMNKIIQILMEK